MLKKYFWHYSRLDEFIKPFLYAGSEEILKPVIGRMFRGDIRNDLLSSNDE